MWNLYLFTLLGCNSDEGLKIYNTAPTISIQSHADGATIQEGIATEFFALASDPNHDTEDLLTSWAAYDSNGAEIASCDWMTPDAEMVQVRRSLGMANDGSSVRS